MIKVCGAGLKHAAWKYSSSCLFVLLGVFITPLDKCCPRVIFHKPLDLSLFTSNLIEYFSRTVTFSYEKLTVVLCCIVVLMILRLQLQVQEKFRIYLLLLINLGCWVMPDVLIALCSHSEEVIFCLFWLVFCLYIMYFGWRSVLYIPNLDMLIFVGYGNCEVKWGLILGCNYSLF